MEAAQWPGGRGDRLRIPQVLWAMMYPSTPPPPMSSERIAIACLCGSLIAGLAGA